MDIELLYKFRLSLSYTLRRNLYFCSKSKDKLHLSIKNKQAYFVLLSVCIIFAPNNAKDYDYKRVFFFPTE